MNWMPPPTLDKDYLRNKYSFYNLVRPRVGLLDNVTFLPQELGSPVFEIASSGLGNLTMTFPHIRDLKGMDVRDRRIGGAGSDIDPELAWVRAVVEGAERYATMVFNEKDFVVATAHDLGSEALDLDTIPRCSEVEYSDPRCPLRPPSKDDPIRWLRGYSLVTGKERFVPAIMTHLHIKAWTSERFWLPISTGVAAHTSLSAALTSAICESIERDSIALTWLAQLRLPQVVIKPPIPVALESILSRLNSSRVKQRFFDATTDIGIPTIFSVQTCEGHASCSLFVSCATSLDPVVACGKAIREAAPARNVMNRERTLPASVEDFFELTHGADYYGTGNHNSDFDFLLNNGRTTSLDQIATIPLSENSDAQGLASLVSRLRSLGMEAIAIDLTTEELRRAGLWVVRVIVPQLMPISFVHRARYLGTPRLFEYARHSGAGNLNSSSINPGPMPFA